MSLAVALGVALAGGAGAVSRWFVDAILFGRASEGFPRGVLLVNLSGAFALGVLAGSGVAGAAAQIAGAGYLGGYTTFSSWMLGSARVAGGPRPHAGLSEGNMRRRRSVGAANLVLALAGGLILVWAGRKVGLGLR